MIFVFNVTKKIHLQDLRLLYVLVLTENIGAGGILAYSIPHSCLQEHETEKKVHGHLSPLTTPFSHLGKEGAKFMC